MAVSALLAFYDAQSVSHCSVFTRTSQGSRTEGSSVNHPEKHVSNVAKVTGQHVLSGSSNSSRRLRNKKKKKWVSQALNVWIVRTVAYKCVHVCAHCQRGKTNGQVSEVSSERTPGA